MKHKQNGSTHVILTLVLILVIAGALGAIFWKNINTNDEQSHSQTESDAQAAKSTFDTGILYKNGFVVIERWNVKFPSDIPYKALSVSDEKVSSEPTSYAFIKEGLSEQCWFKGYIGIISLADDSYTPASQEAIVENPYLLLDGLITVDNINYIYRGPQTECSKTDENLNKTFNMEADRINQGFKYLQSYK